MSTQDFENIRGVGTRTAEKLRKAHIQSISDLADADAVKLSPECSLPEGVLHRLIAAAREQCQRGGKSSAANVTKASSERKHESMSENKGDDQTHPEGYTQETIRDPRVIRKACSTIVAEISEFLKDEEALRARLLDAAMEKDGFRRVVISTVVRSMKD